MIGLPLLLNNGCITRDPASNERIEHLQYSTVHWNNSFRHSQLPLETPTIAHGKARSKLTQVQHFRLVCDGRLKQSIRCDTLTHLGKAFEIDRSEVGGNLNDYR